MQIGIQKVTAKIFVQDPFNPIYLSEDSEKYIEVESIICIVTPYKYNQDKGTCAPPFPWQALTVCVNFQPPLAGTNKVRENSLSYAYLSK